MLTTLLLISLLTADPATVKPEAKAESPAASAVPLTTGGTAPAPAEVPANFQAYFERAEESHAATIKRAEVRIEEQEVEYRGAIPARKAPLRRNINLDKSRLAEDRKRTPIADLPKHPKPGDIGHLRSAKVLAVLDDTSLVAKILAQPLSKANVSGHALLRLESTKGITSNVNTKSSYQPTNTWIVLDESLSDNESAMKWVPRTQTARKEVLLVLKAVPASELAQHRAAWLATRKQK